MTWDGLLLIHKPTGETSHTVVQRVKERLQAEKAGHLGTLDPIATGVFPVCLGKATRLSPFYMGADKSYLAEIRFGFFTNTDDREGKQESPFTKPKFSARQLEEVIRSFQGEFHQKPPIFSAKKIQGKKAYDLARAGIRPDLPLQKVEIHEIRLMHFEKDTAVIYIHCGSGTYVRSITREIGTRLRCGAYVNELARTKFGKISLEDCSAPDAGMDKLKKSFVPVSNMLEEYPRYQVDAAQEKRVLNGSSIVVPGTYEAEWIRIFDPDGNLLAFARAVSGEKMELQPRIVFKVNEPAL
jgi:tRNA pseudouridine55 synthase